jgi:hypothetical protein
VSDKGLASLRKALPELKVICNRPRPPAGELE